MQAYSGDDIPHHEWFVSQVVGYCTQVILAELGHHGRGLAPYTMGLGSPQNLQAQYGNNKLLALHHSLLIGTHYYMGSMIYCSFDQAE